MILRYKADIRTLTFVGIYFLIAYSGYILYPQLNTGATILWVLATCNFSFFCAVIVHNTIHCPIFRKRKWNKRFQFILSFAYGHSVSAYVPGHNLSHHKETQTLKDTMRTTKARFKWNLLNQALFFFIVSFDVMIAEIAWAKKMRKEKPTWFRQYIAELVLLFSIKVLLLVINWKAALLFIWLPHIYGQWGIVGTNIWQHDGCDQTHPYNHSRTFTSPFINYVCFNNGFHTGHHDKPGLHWSLLPAYHEENVAPFAHPNLNRYSLFKYLWESYAWPGKRLDYLGNPMPQPTKTKDVDWVESFNWKANRQDLGAEAVV